MRVISDKCAMFARLSGSWEGVSVSSNIPNKDERRNFKPELEMGEVEIKIPKELLEELSVRAMVEERRVSDIVIELVYNYLNR